jgi:hypothetical protein
MQVLGGGHVLFRKTKGVDFQGLLPRLTSTGNQSPKGFPMNYFGRFSRTACLGAVFSLAVNLAVAAPQAGRAKVVQVSGSAYVGSAAAAVGSEVGAGSIIKAGPAAEVVLNLGANGGLSRIMEDSVVTIDQLTVDGTGSEKVVNTVLTLKSGKIESQVSRLSKNSKYIVQTPTGSVSVKGTLFTAYATGAVLVWEGTVEVTVKDPQTGRETKYTVSANQLFDPNIPGVALIPAGTGAPAFAMSRLGGMGPGAGAGSGGGLAAGSVGTSVFVQPTVQPTSPTQPAP